MLMDADATDPSAIGYATVALAALNASVLNRDLPADRRVQPVPPPFQIVLHARYNPQQITALNIVPGLIGLILTVSTLIITSLAITRERETDTMENQLAMPIRTVEVMLGKVIPYVGLTYVQTALILVVSVGIFQQLKSRFHNVRRLPAKCVRAGRGEVWKEIQLDGCNVPPGASFPGYETRRLGPYRQGAAAKP